MAVRFLPDASGFDLSVERDRTTIEGAGEIWAAWLRAATVIPSLFIENENGDVQEVQITEPVVVKTPYKSISLSNVAGVGTLRVATSGSLCDAVNLGGVAGVADARPESVQASAYEIVGAGGGFNWSYIELWNPVESGFNMLFDMATFELGANTSISVRTDTVQRGTVGTDTTHIAPNFTDQRNTNTPVVEIGYIQSAVRYGVGITQTLVGARFEFRPPFPIVITPGNSLLFKELIADKILFVSALWRELPV